MSTQISMKNAVVLAKIESDSGTEQAPSATDALLCTDVQIDPLAGSAIDINYIRPYFGGYPSLRVEDFVTCSITCDLVGNASAANPGAPYDALLRACGTAKTALSAVAPANLVAGSTTTTLALTHGASPASSVDNFYVGQTIQVDGFPARTIVGYVGGTTRMATVHKAYATAPPGMAQYTIGAASQYTPASTGLESATLYFNQGGLRHKLIGARGNASLDISANGRPVIKFDMIGIFSPVADASDSANYAGWGNPQTINSANTWAIIDGKLADGSATGIQAMKWTMDFGNAVKHRQLIGSAKVPITDRVTKGSTSIELTTVAFNAWIARIRASSKSVMAIEHGLTPGNIVNVWLPNSQLTDPKYSDSDGIVMLDMNYSALPLVGNDEFRLTFK